MTTPASLNQWIHHHNVNPHWLCEKLDLDRSAISALIAGEGTISPMLSYALVGLSAEMGGPRRPGMKAPAAPKGPLRGRMAGSNWSERTARLAMPILVDRAIKKAGTITYGDLHTAVVAVGADDNIGRMTKYAFALGHIATAMSEIAYEDIPVPPLTALVVNARTGLPSSGIDPFIIAYCYAMGRRKDAKIIEQGDNDGRKAVFETIWSEIQEFRHWRTILSECGLTGRPDFDQ